MSTSPRTDQNLADSASSTSPAFRLDLLADLAREMEAENSHMKRVLQSIVTDCRRGAHRYGMSAEGVTDIANRAEKATNP